LIVGVAVHEEDRGAARPDMIDGACLLREVRKFGGIAAEQELDRCPVFANAPRGVLTEDRLHVRRAVKADDRLHA